MKCTSLWQPPLATVRTSTSRPMGLAISTFSMVSGLWGPWKTAAFMSCSFTGWSGRAGRGQWSAPSGLALQRPALAGDEVREGRFGLGPAHHAGGVAPLVRPLLLERAPEILQQQGLHADDRLAPVLGDHRRQPHGLGP